MIVREDEERERQIKCCEYTYELKKEAYRIEKIRSYQIQVQCSFLREIVWYDEKMMGFGLNRVWLKFYLYHLLAEQVLFKTNLKQVI